ncbi:hypothetical protein E3P99_00827 [Wallemia hederae]|uniref:Bromo domain-containing protein n=1 Tax=Wallemia hederae TaxID=1540922 RepID=A0A4V4LTW0_9BASI|nr:hypothetical protein E3P99_00827 [Wallemia hederae]
MDYDDIFDTDLINVDSIINYGDFDTKRGDEEMNQAVDAAPKPSKSLSQSISDCIDALWDFDSEGIFHKPVNTKLVRDYNRVIKRPMDLSTVKAKSNSRSYKDMDALKADLLLIATNAKMYNPPGNYYHNKALDFESFLCHLLDQEASNYVIINDTRPAHQSLPIAWGVYSGDEQEEDSSEENDVNRTSLSPSRSRSASSSKHPSQPTQLLPFDREKFLNYLRLYSEPNPVVPINTPSIFAKKSRIQKKRLSRREIEALERDPYPKNADGSIRAEEFDDPWSIIPQKRSYNTPLLLPVCTPQSEPNFRPTSLPSQPGFYFKYTAYEKPKHQQHSQMHTPRSQSQTPQLSSQPQTPQPQPQTQLQPQPSITLDASRDTDGPRQATVLDYGAYKGVPCILSRGDQHLFKTAYQLQGDAMMHTLSKITSDELSTRIHKHLDEKFGPVTSIPGNGGWEVFYRNYLHDQIKNSVEYIDDIYFGGAQGKAYMKSLSNFVKQSLSDCGMDHTDTRAQYLLDRVSKTYTSKLATESATLKSVLDAQDGAIIDDSIRQSFEYYTQNRPQEVRNLAYKSYLRSEASRVDPQSLLLEDNLAELAKSPYEDIHARPESDPAGVLASLKKMAASVNASASANADADVQLETEQMEVDDDYSELDEIKKSVSKVPPDMAVFKVTAPPLPKPTTSKRAKRTSRSAAAKMKQDEETNANANAKAADSLDANNARVELLKVALKLPAGHLVAGHYQPL